MSEDLDSRKVRTEVEIRRIFEDSMQVMLEKNRQRGDCWRNSGLIAQFVEIHSMYFRLRNLIWEDKESIPDADSDKWTEWEQQVANALEDLRNFTMLAELCLQERNIRGEKYTDDEL